MRHLIKEQEEEVSCVTASLSELVTNSKWSTIDDLPILSTAFNESGAL